MIRRLAKWLALACAAVIGLSVLVVALLRWLNPPTSAFMVRASLADATLDIRYRWVDFEEISPDAAVAVIAAEDQWFPFHAGFDLGSIREAAERNAKRRRVRGASTISQQVAKNLFLWPERSYVRKGLEAYFTVLIELLWPKERILEVYLNVAQFGRGVYGVDAAARRFFRKPAARLDAYESALLAAVLPNPRRLRVDRPSTYVGMRRDWILVQARGLGGRSYLLTVTANGKGRIPDWAK
ncbi:MAG: monofunctional biosynthetic peptidoglycan transglycosylase [Steroidobacteraceae bacterium]